MVNDHAFIFKKKEKNIKFSVFIDPVIDEFSWWIMDIII